MKTEPIMDSQMAHVDIQYRLTNKDNYFGIFPTNK